jgi:hypothetical protein
MRTLSFAVAIAAVTVAHAEPIEDYLRMLRGYEVSGPHDATVLIGADGRSEARCRPVLTELHPAPARNAYSRSCIEGEWRQGPLELLENPSMPP